jgi:hypothetical protein
MMIDKPRALVGAFEQVGAAGVAQVRTEERTEEPLGLKSGMARCRLVTHAVLRWCGRYFLHGGNWQGLRQRWMALVLAVVLAGCPGLILLQTRPG